MAAAPPRWLQPAVDYGPVAVFFAVYHLKDIMWATGAIMVAAAVAVAVGWIWERRLPPLPLFTAVMVGVFGALTLVLADETFIKMKTTIINGILSLALFGGLAFGIPLLRLLFGAVLPLDLEGWRKLSLRMALFFAGMAALNEIVWRTQSTEFWVNYKLFGPMVLMVLFFISQAGLINRHRLRERPPPPG